MVRYYRISAFLTILFMCGVVIGQVNNTETFGNKYNNLVRLQSIVQDMPNSAIPPFLAISTERIETFLKNNAPEVFTHYNSVINQLYPNQNTSLLQRVVHKAKGIMVGIELIKSVEDQLDEIQKTIEGCFNRLRFDFTSEEQKFFEAICSKNQFLMVRSTGIEDSQTTANAGGNTSIAYVQAYATPIEDAMGKVVASYFSMQSLKNRMVGGEDLRKSRWCVPVLIQALIGEPLGGGTTAQEIPISGVAFTTNQQLSNEKFSLTEINAAYGHGEGVVANRVIADRYYVTQSRSKPDEIAIYPMLYYKKDRLVSAGRKELTFCKNSNDVAYKSALSQNQVKELHGVLKKIEAAYGQPMDVEFVVLDKTIYIVQARPAMHHIMNPSYFELERIEDGDISQIISGITIVSGSAQLLVIKNAEDIIVTDTLDEADQKNNSAQCKAVIVSRWASSLSHAAVNFMSHGIPCLYVENLDNIKQLMKQLSPQRPLIIDVQRHTMFLWQNAHKEYTQCICNKWFEHPINATLSLFIDNLGFAKSQKSVLPHDGKLMACMNNLKKASTYAEKKELCSAITERITQRLALTERRMLHAKILCDETFTQLFSSFKMTIEKILVELHAAIDQQADHFEFLFYHKMLEALLYQDPRTQSMLGVYNYSYFLNELFTHQDVFMMLRKHKNHIKSHDEFTYAKYCPTKELAKEWCEFLIALQAAHESSDVVTFKNILSCLNTLHALPLWFATEFYQAMHKQPISTLPVEKKIESAQTLVSTTLALYGSKESCMLLKELQRCAEAIEQIRAQQGKIGSLQETKELWQCIKDDLINPLTAMDFINNFKKSPSLVKMLTCDVMRDGIEVIDTALKAIKTNGALAWPEKITQFKTMLNDFNMLFRVWVTDIMPENALTYHDQWPLSYYLNKMQMLYDEILNKNDTQSMFQRSADFSVNAAMLGSATAFERHYPETVEDIFMLIHQNALVAVSATCVSLCNEKRLDEFLYLPPLLTTIMQYLESDDCKEIITSDAHMPQRIGISYGQDTIQLLYNMSLRNHSSTFQIIYKQAAQECVFTVQFLGEARKRWEQIAFLAGISKDLSGIELVDTILLDKKAGIVSWGWLVKDLGNLKMIMQYLAIMAAIANNSGNYSDFPFDKLESLYKKQSLSFEDILQNVHVKYKYSDWLW